MVSPTPAPALVPNIPVISPGGLDFASSLQIALDAYNMMEAKDSTKLLELLEWWEQDRCGKALCGEIGVDGTGFREDWCIIEIERNPLSRWVGESSLRELLADNSQCPASLLVSGSRRPVDGEIIITNGAMSGWATEMVQEKRLSFGYYKRIADPSVLDPEELPSLTCANIGKYGRSTGRNLGYEVAIVGVGFSGWVLTGWNFSGYLCLLLLRRIQQSP